MFDYIWFRSAHITILPRRHVDVVMAVPKRLPDLNIVFFVIFSPSTFHPRLFTLDFLPSPSTFYPRPRHLTLDTRPIDKLITQWLITALRCRCTRWLHLQYITLFIGWSRNVSIINLDLPKPHLPIFGNHCQKSNDLKVRQ